ncbi:MAG: hypothetical protein JXB88_07650 [Spirochaetales bacterium]|nr:hypothetical protein [Spirochaetales bacterium]
MKKCIFYIIKVRKAGYKIFILYLIGIKRIIATLPKLLSNRYEGALIPIELANGIASLSTYPSAKILELFADANE